MASDWTASCWAPLVPGCITSEKENKKGGNICTLFVWIFFLAKFFCASQPTNKGSGDFDDAGTDIVIIQGH